MKVSTIEILKRELQKSNECRQQIVEMLSEVALDALQVFDFGAIKHPDSGSTPNFLTPEGNKCSRHVRGSGVLRHAARTFMHPELLDEESKVSELLHLISSTSILYIRHKRNIVHSEDAVNEPVEKTQCGGGGCKCSKRNGDSFSTVPRC